MNYQPVTACNQSNPSACFQDKFDAKKAGEESDQQYVLFPVWSFGFTNPQNTNEDVAFDEKEPEFDEKNHESEVNVSPSSSAQSKKQDDKTKREAKGKSLIESFIRYRDLSEEFEDLFDNSINEVNTTGTLVPTVKQISPNITNTFSVVGPSNAAASPTHRKSSYIDASQLPDDLDMPELEDITYSDDEDDVGAEVDFNNLETSITVSPIPTTRVHKDHPVTQIIEEPKRVHQDFKDLSWIEAMQEELLQFKMQKVWILVDLPYGKRAIGTKWVFRNRKDERGIVVRKKARLVAQEHTHEERIDYEEVFAPVSMIEAIRLFLAYASFIGFMVYQMDVKNGKSASTPIDTEKPLLKDPDGEDVDVHTYRSMIGSLMYLTSSRPDIMFTVYACAHFQVTPKASHLHAVKRIFRYLKGRPHLGLWYPKDSPFDLVAYSNSDYTGASLDRKSTTRGCQFLGCRLISWQSRKQTVVATSFSEAEYVATARQTATGKEISNPFIAGACCCMFNDGKVHAAKSKFSVFWTAVAIKKVNEVTRLQALVDKNKVVITEAMIRDALCLDDTKGCMSAKRTSWHEFSSLMASAEVSEGVADEVHDKGVPAAGVANEGDVSAAHDEVPTADEEPFIPSPTPPTPPPQPSQDIPSTSQVQPTPPQSPQERMIAEMNHDADVVLEEAEEVADDAKADEDAKVLSMHEEETEPAEVQEVVEVVTTAKLINEVVTTASTTITATEVPVPAAITAVVPKLTTAPSRRTKGVVIRDHEESTTTTSTIIHTEAKSKDKGKEILVEEPKPFKKQAQIEQDEKYARELEAELNRNIDWDEVIDHVKTKAKEDPAVKRYQALKRKPQTEAQARKNMMVYLKNVAGFKMDYFKGMSYDDIRPIIEAKFDSNMAFLQKIKEQIKEGESRALKRINETPEEKAAKRKK
nr:hypothetical protein [Tanacetum cinerariifolium]